MTTVPLVFNYYGNTEVEYETVVQVLGRCQRHVDNEAVVIVGKVLQACMLRFEAPMHAHYVGLMS